MNKPATIDEYLQALPDEQRQLLQRVRAQIRAAAPEAQEYIGYGMPGFKVAGRPLLYLGAAKNHCALYGARADAALAQELSGWKQSKGTIQFTLDKPLPATIVKRIVKARLAALAERVGDKPAARKSTPKAALAKRTSHGKASKKKAATSSQRAAASARAPKKRT